MQSGLSRNKYDDPSELSFSSVLHTYLVLHLCCQVLYQKGVIYFMSRTRRNLYTSRYLYSSVTKLKLTTQIVLI